MSSQEDINAETPSDASKDAFEPKQTPKIIRVLTVMAYVLSVSMAAILLSIYYIFMWKGHPHIGAQRSIGDGLHSAKLTATTPNNFTGAIEEVTTVPILTTSPEDEENTTWPDYTNDFDQKRKRSIFLKKIMNFKYPYDDGN